MDESKDEIRANFENVEAQLQSFHNPQKMGGFAVAVFDADTTFYVNGFGYADLENGIPYTVNTEQYVASIAKTTIGIALLKAQELGLLKVEDPINQYLPFEVKNPKFPSSPITIRHLSTHTSSLDYNEAVVESLYVEEELKRESLASFMDDYFNSGTVKYSHRAPGEDWNYSNIGASLAAYIIELQSDMSFSAFTQQYIFDPLRIENTTWFESHSDSNQWTTYYEIKEKKLRKVKTSGVQLYPSRDMITNVQDLTTYCQAIIAQDQRLLSKASFATLLAPSLSSKVSNQSVDNHGLFFMIDRNQYGITYQLTGMNGGDNCINTMMWFDPVTEIGYIFIGNTGQVESNRVAHIWIYRTLVSLGDHVTLEQSMKYKWHNIFSRLRAVF
ncbi:MAG: serine hydrolase [Bacteroidota bacterium]